MAEYAEKSTFASGCQHTEVLVADLRRRYTRTAMRHRSKLPVGKLPPEVLRGLLRTCRPPASSGVVIGPRYGEDAAVIDLGSRYLVAKSDPITFTEERIGWYAVNINANDIAALGARPRWFLATLLLPEAGTTRALAQRIFRDIAQSCRALGVTLCGGHTEITGGLSRPIVVGQMLGEATRPELIRKESQQPGDVILLTRGVAIEGTAILARAKATVLEKLVGRAVVRRAQKLLRGPGISVVRDARLAVRWGKVHAMHDPTEGGLLSGLAEIAAAGNVGLRVWMDKIPVLPETQALSRALGFDPLALIASGALLVVATPASSSTLLRAYARRGIAATIIGEILPRREGNSLVVNGRSSPLRVPARDEIARLLQKPRRER